MGLHNLMGFFSILFGHFALAEFNFQTFQNRNSPDFVFLDSTIEKTDDYQNTFLSSLTYQYHKNPINFDKGEDGRGSLVSHIQNLNLVTEYIGWKRFSLGLEAAVHQLSYYGQGDQFSLGDTRLYSKIHLFGERISALGKWYFVPSVYFPTGDSKLLLSNSHGGAGGNIVLEKNIGPLLAVANLGADYFPEASHQNLDYQMQSYAGLGARLQFSEKWGGSTEWMGRQIRDMLTGDFYGGVQYYFSEDGKLRMGASMGSTETAVSDPEYRILLGLSWATGGTKVVHTETKTIQKIKTINDCRPKLYQKKFSARALTEKEKMDFIQGRKLPFIFQPDLELSLINPGQSTESKKNSWARKALVLFAIDLNGLPEQVDVVAVKKLNLQLDINKFWVSKDEQNDMICFINEKICSGNLSNQTPGNSINDDFFKGKEPPNDFFTRKISDLTYGQTPSPGKISSGQLTLPLARLIENSTLPAPLSLLYSRTLYFSVSQDVFLQKKIKLDVELSANSCTETQPEATVETHIEEQQMPLNKDINHE